MVLRSCWDETQRSIIRHLKAVFPDRKDQRGIETRLMMDIMLFGSRLEKEPLPFFKQWKYFKKNRHFTNDLGIHSPVYGMVFSATGGFLLSVRGQQRFFPEKIP